MKQSKGKKGISLAISVIVTAALIVVWHFAAPQLMEHVDINLVKFVSYALLLFGMTWILNEAMGLVKAPEGTTEEQISVLHNRRALVGMVAYLLYSALVHAVVSVLFDNGEKQLMLRVASVEKCALAFIGYCLLLQNAMHVESKSTLTVVSGAVVFVLGAVLSLFLDQKIVAAILAAVTLVFFYVDATTTYKKLGVSSNKFVARQIGLLAIISLVMIFRYFTAIHFGGKVFRFVLSAIINLVIAVVVDVILIVVMKASGKKSESQRAAAATRK